MTNNEFIFPKVILSAVPIDAATDNLTVDPPQQVGSGDQTFEEQSLVAKLQKQIKELQSRIEELEEEVEEEVKPWPKQLHWQNTIQLFTKIFFIKQQADGLYKIR